MTLSVATTSRRATNFWWHERPSASMKRYWKKRILAQHNGLWTRSIIDTWMDHPIYELSHLPPIVDWCEGCFGHFWFVSPRSTMGISHGVQIWTTHEDDRLILQLLQTPIRPVRRWATNEFEDGLSVMIDWAWSHQI